MLKILFITILFTLIISSISIYLHHPKTPILTDNWGFKYNDIVYGILNPRFSPYLKQEEIYDNWLNVTKYYLLTRGRRVITIPYIDYKFEYPPLIGLLWLISVNTAIYLNLPEKYTYQLYIDRYDEIIATHYVINSIVNTMFLSLTIIFIGKSLYLLGINNKKILLILVFPSLYMYLTYNWDIICGFFLLAGLYYFYKRKWFLSGLLLGLSISTKILPIIYVLITLIYMIVRLTLKKYNVRILMRYLNGLVLGVTPFILLMIFSFQGFIDLLTYHASWYCENCLSQIFEHDIFNDIHRIFSLATISFSIIVLLFIIMKKELYPERDAFRIGLLSMLVVISLNYVTTPQMILLVIPLTIILLDKHYLILYWLADLLNSMIMVIFFIERDIRIYLHNMGLPVSTEEFNPWTIISPVQWIAITRNLILLSIVILILFRLYKDLN